MELINLDLVKDNEIKEEIKRVMQDFYDLFAENRLQGGMIHSFLYDCVGGQILLKIKGKQAKYINSFSDFYIDDRVRFKGRRRLYKLMSRMSETLKQVV